MPSHEYKSDLANSFQRNHCFRQRDPARLAQPSRSSTHPVADKDGKNQLMDAEDTTIGMPVFMFQQEFLLMDAACQEAFNVAFPKEKIRRISAKFRQGFLASQNAAPYQKEKVLSRTWVSCIHSPVMLSLYRTFRRQ